MREEEDDDDDDYGDDGKGDEKYDRDGKSKKSSAVAAGSDEEEMDEDAANIAAMMGFGGFGSTKGKEVASNKNTAARGATSVNKARKYRQYMNRKGGFNRALDKI